VVHGNGQVDFLLRGTSGNGTDFASREHGRPELRPQLVLTAESGPGCMPRTETATVDIQSTYDGYVSQSQPTRRFGSEPVLRVDAAPERWEAFVQFRFSLPEEWHVRQAKLRLYATDATTDGPVLYRASDAWPVPPDFDIDWNTRPALTGGPVGNLGAITAGTWAEYDVSSLVTSDGIYSFGLLPESADGVNFYSGDTDWSLYPLRPQLSLTVESEPYCTYRGTGGGLTGWTRHYGGAGLERLHALATDAQGNLVAAGLFGDAPFPNQKGFALARYTADGTPVWTRQVTAQDARVRAITVTPLGNILVVGNYNGSPDLGTGPLPAASSSSYSPGLFVAKFSPTGQAEWAHGFSATYVRPPEGELEHWAVVPTSVATDANGSLIVGGGFHGQMDLGGGPLSAGTASVYPEDPFPGGFVAKFSWNGQHLWSRAFEAGGFAMPGWVRAVATDSAGNVLVGGHVNSNANLGDGQTGTRAPFIAKYTPSGAFVWKRLFTGAYGEVVG
ncbi:MAG TPA: DNRLRE domain-containing protein, partial [Archangium sp.]